MRWAAPIALLAALVAAAPAGAATNRTERVVGSRAPDAAKVRESYVRLRDPLPADAGPHPAACDWVSYLRYRNPKGPSRPSRADAVVVLIPGFLGGAGSFDQLARNTVRNAARRGSYLEVWALDRRANCLEDHAGLRAAARAGDASIAYRYYWGDEEVGGKRFGGFVSPADASFLGGFGLERTVRDWYTVITRELPNRRRRARKLVCGGHSLGGQLTAAFASWDFDGDAATLADAGYSQCAGLVGLDTTVSISGGGNGGVGLTDAIGLLGQTGAAPYVNVPPLTPETIQVPGVFGVGAFFEPRATNLLPELPRTTGLDLAQRALFSRNAVHFATGIPSIRDFTIDNAAVLGGVLDDNSAGLSFLRTSVGMVVGGELADKNFPTPDSTLAIPTDKSATYRWQGYREVGAGGAPIPLNDEGEPYTSRESEVSSIRELARALFEAPADFTEQYFPTRLLSDVAAAMGGSRGGSLEGLRHDGPAQRPVLLIQGGDSESNDPPDVGPPTAGTAPNTKPLSAEWILPGYNHLDVLTAARRQNDGRPEPSAKTLTDYVLRLIPPPPKLRIKVRPRRIRAGERVRLRFRVKSKSAACRRRVLIKLAGKRVRTGPRGGAKLRVRLRKRGRRLIVARKAGCRVGKSRVRVLKRHL